MIEKTTGLLDSAKTIDNMRFNKQHVFSQVVVECCCYLMIVIVGVPQPRRGDLAADRYRFVSLLSVSLE